MSVRVTRFTLLAVLVAYVALGALVFHVDVPGRNGWFLGGGLALSLAATALLSRCRLRARHLALLILGVGAVLQLIALTHSPLTSDDANRYVWDGRVQLAGVDPYSYAPSAPELAHLRIDSLFGTTSACTHPFDGGCTSINRPDVRTIYPPVAQAAFVVGRLLSFGSDGLLAFQVLGALGSLAVAALLLRHARHRGAALWPVTLWAWSPVVVSEFGQNGHIDWLGVLLTVLALSASSTRRTVWAGLLLGAAIGTKLYPGLVLPAIMRRRPVLVVAVTVGFLALVYLPHVLAVGPDVIGYLPGYLTEQGYGSGDRLLLLGLVLPHPLDSVVGAIILALVGMWAWRRGDPAAPEQAAAVVVGTALLVATPVYGWYGAILLALAVLSRRYEWILVAVAPSVTYLIRGDHTYVPDVIVYALALVGTFVARRYRLRSDGTSAVSENEQHLVMSGGGPAVAVVDRPHDQRA